MTAMVVTEWAIDNITADDWEGLDLRVGLLAHDAALVVDESLEFVEDLNPGLNEVSPLTGYARQTATPTTVRSLGVRRYSIDTVTFPVLDGDGARGGFLFLNDGASDADRHLIAAGIQTDVVPFSGTDPFVFQVASGLWRVTQP